MRDDYRDVQEPRDDAWRDAESDPPPLGQAVWSTNELLRHPLISKRGHKDDEGTYTVLADLYEGIPANFGMGTLHIPSKWQPIVR